MNGNSSTKGDRTKAALRGAAAGYFREVGFQAATTAEIARRAGVSEGTLFLHYSNKLGLLTAVTAEFYAALQADGERVLAAGARDTSELLRALTLNWAENMSQAWGFIQVFIQVAATQPGTDLATTVIRANRAYTRLFTGLIDRLKIEGLLPASVPTALLRDMLLGCLEHTARGHQYASRAIDTTTAAKTALDLLLSISQPARELPAERLDAIESKLDALLERAEPDGQTQPLAR